MTAEAKEYMSHERKIVNNEYNNLAYVINIDQTPFFKLHSKRIF